MVKAYDAATLALLDGDSLVFRDLVVIQMPEGTWGFWSDVFEAEFPGYWPGVIFTGSGTLIQITQPAQTVGTDVQTVTGTLSGLASDVLATVGTYNLHRARVEIARALYNPTTRALVTVDVRFRGYIEREEERESDGEAHLVIECVSRARELDRATYRKRTGADQRRTFPNDLGLNMTNAAVNTRITVGR
ncbi:hypothetical protein ACLBXM_18000 [Xanthobacteraceae bacterium A53D]